MGAAVLITLVIRPQMKTLIRLIYILWPNIFLLLCGDSNGDSNSILCLDRRCMLTNVKAVGHPLLRIRGGSIKQVNYFLPSTKLESYAPAFEKEKIS